MKKILRALRNSGLMLISGAMLLLPKFVFAASAIPPGTIITLGTLEMWIRQIGDFLLTIGVIVAVIFLVWGGITYMAAGGDSEKATKAKTLLWNGVIGALIILGVGVIIRTISWLVLGNIQTGPWGQ